MDSLHFLLLFITGPPGMLSMQTLNKVTVQTGGSVSIPCHYDQKYKDSVKYWCRGLLWGTCFVVVRTDSPQKRRDVSITDDPAQQVFTVTLRNLQLRDTNQYWCAVSIKGIGTPDDKAGVFLSVTKGTPPPLSIAATLPATPPCAQSTGKPSAASPFIPKGVLSMQTLNKVTVQTGGSVSIPCHYDQKYKDSVKYWCRGLLWGTCFVVVRTDFPQKRGDVSITDDPAQQVFTVTLRNLQLRDTNQYWCAVSIKGIGTLDDKAGVFLSVTKAAFPLTTQQTAVSAFAATSPFAGDCAHCTAPQSTAGSGPPTVWSSPPESLPPATSPAALSTATTSPATPPSALSTAIPPPTTSLSTLSSATPSPTTQPSALSATTPPPATPPSTLSTAIPPPTTSLSTLSSATPSPTTQPSALSATTPPPATPPSTLSASTSPPINAPSALSSTTTSPATPPSALSKTTPPPATPLSTRSTATPLRGKPPSTLRLHWWQSLLIACGVLLLAATLAMVTWRMWRHGKNSYSRWEMDEMEPALTLHTDNDADPTSHARIFLKRPVENTCFSS